MVPMATRAVREQRKDRWVAASPMMNIFILPTVQMRRRISTANRFDMGGGSRKDQFSITWSHCHTLSHDIYTFILHFILCVSPFECHLLFIYIYSVVSTLVSFYWSVFRLVKVHFVKTCITSMANLNWIQFYDSFLSLVSFIRWMSLLM